MEYRPIEITLISAKDLKDVNLLSKMDVYAVVTINGDPQTKQKTPVDKDCGSNPKWNHVMKFTVDDAVANQNRLNFVIRLVSNRKLGDKEIGEVVVPVKELLEGKDKVMYDYSVRTPSGKPKGILNLSCKIGEKFNVPVAAPPQHQPQYMEGKGKVGETPMMAYPAAGSSMGYPSAAGSSMAYPPPPPSGYPYNYPPPGGYPPPPQGYGGYPPPPQPGYGYQGYPPQAGYGKPPKRFGGGGAGVGLGLAGGLLGGLLIGDMVSDIADNSAYDAGGFDDGGFDF